MDEDEAVKSQESKDSSFDNYQKESVYSVFQNLFGKFRNIEYVLLAEYERAIEWRSPKFLYYFNVL